ncbi:MAG: SUMF1/EgtB/PvdO family nonheme iron enzyme [Bacteroidota bacterium]
MTGQFPDNRTADKGDSGVLPGTLAGILYLAGVAYFIYRFLRNLFRIRDLYRFNPKEIYPGYDITLLPEEYPTFSFFNHIFLNNKGLSPADSNYIILHELVHIKQRHSVDIILIEICKAVFWFNPFIWLYKNALVKVHECQADRYFVENNPEDLTDYQSLLLKQYLSKISIELAHPFNYSFIKYRIKMMTKIKSNRIAKYKTIFAFPVVLLGLLAFSNAKENPVREGSKSKAYIEASPAGMVFIPQGSFVLKRTDGSVTKEFNVSLDAFWMKETEVTIEEYSGYLESLKKDSANRVYEAALPDISCAPFPGYFNNKAYMKYPVVGVSLKQARDFCFWKTVTENRKLSLEGKPLVANYRIPFEVEWIYASLGGQNPELKNTPSVPGLLEIKKGKEIKKDCNEFGLIYMFSNVSEWTNTAFDPDKYLNELQNTPLDPAVNIVVRGENYKKELLNNKLILRGGDSFDYVGFRYVRTYIGR